MDEFLALMDEEAPSGPQPEDDHPASLDPMVEFASLLEESSSLPTFERDANEKKRKSNSVSSAAPSTTKVATVSVDEKLGIRMINRHLSSLDLLDLITTGSPFHSPAKLSAMSLQSLCGILVDPPSVIDRATVQGRTYLVTVGIVFENSGTKTSSKGGAFCILTIGSNLESGPCLSVFLFGTAYTKYCRSCQAGQVVAVCNPKLLPARDDYKGGRNDTSISMSVYDHTQLILVAKARDYGVCQATVGRKQADGTWKNNAGTCKSYVDKRQGDFCPFHAKQKREKEHKNNRLAHCSSMRGMGGVAATSRSSRGGNLVQQHKASKTQGVRDIGKKSLGNPYVSTSFVGTGRSNVVTPTNPGRVNASAASNRFLNPGGISMKQTSSVSVPDFASSTMPKHMKQQEERTTKIHALHDRCNMKPHTGQAGGSRPTGSMNQSRADSTSLRKQANTVMASGDWMKQAASRRTPKSLSNYFGKSSGGRTVSTVGGGFDGSVPVPKPKVFTKEPPKFINGGTSNKLDQMRKEQEQQKIMEKQTILAEKMRERKAGTGTATTSKFTTLKNKDSHSNPSTPGNSFLDSIQVEDVEAVLNAKSRFAAEADAEEYAKNRRRVVELEQLETKQNKQKSARRDKENQKILQEWVCRTCANAPRFTVRPTQCISIGHDVKKTRKIKDNMTKTDERTQLHDKGADNGGLQLGRGLEWSKNRFNDINLTTAPM